MTVTTVTTLSVALEHFEKGSSARATLWQCQSYSGNYLHSQVQEKMSQHMWIQFCISVACIPSTDLSPKQKANSPISPWPFSSCPWTLRTHDRYSVFLGHLEGLVCGLQSQIGWPPCCNLSLYNSAPSPTSAEDLQSSNGDFIKQPQTYSSSRWKHQVILLRKWQSLVALSEFERRTHLLQVF